MKIAFSSDTHIDFWVPAKLNSHTLMTAIEKFVDETLVPKPADILIFAGDNSHYNEQNRLMLQYIADKQMYKKIFVTFGNHDMYIVSNSQRKKYDYSWDKVEELKEICENIDTVEFLDGNIVEVDGVKIGGCGLWYDGSYAKNVFGYNDTRILQLWKDTMNDANLIIGKDKNVHGLNGVQGMYSYGKTKSYTFDPDLFFQQEKEKLMKIVYDCDIFISHIGPVVPPTIRTEYKTPTTGFYYFDGEHILWNEKAPKVWFSGHTHDKTEFKINNTWLMCNPLGYKSERTGNEIDVIDTESLY